MIVKPDSTARPRRPGLSVAIAWGLVVAVIVVGVVMAATSERGVDREFGRAGTGLWPALAAPATEPARAPTIGELPLGTESIYVGSLDREGVAYPSERSVIATGHAVCEFLAVGGTVLSAPDIAELDGYDPNDAQVVVGAAWQGLCPGGGW